MTTSNKMPPRLYAHEGFEGHWSGSSERCCEEDQEYISKVEVESKLREIREALEFYLTPSFISRDQGKTWQELVRLIPHVYSEKFNPNIQREVEFGTVAREALALLDELLKGNV